MLGLLWPKPKRQRQSRKKTLRTRKVRLPKRFQRGGGILLNVGAGIGLTVDFGTTLCNKNLNKEALSSNETVQTQPTVTWISQDKPVTLMCWDTDAVGQPNTVYIHWLVNNINKNNIANGNEILSWTPPNPPQGSAPVHNYYIGLFDGPVENVKNRNSFDPQAQKPKLLDWCHFKVKSPSLIK